MYQLIKPLIKRKWLLTCLLIVAILFATTWLGLADIAGSGQNIMHMSNWLHQHKNLVIVWHIVIILAIYVAWGIKIDRASKRLNLKDGQIKKAKRMRLYMIAFVIVIDVLTFWV